MINTKFELYKFRRELRRNGSDYTFRRRKLNQFNEPTGDLEDVLTICCLYSVYGDKKVLRFVGIVDIQNYGILADISLEVVDDGCES